MQINLNASDMRLIVECMIARVEDIEDPAKTARLFALIGRFEREIALHPVKRKKALAVMARLKRERDYSKGGS